MIYIHSSSTLCAPPVRPCLQYSPFLAYIFIALLSFVPPPLCAPALSIHPFNLYIYSPLCLLYALPFLAYIHIYSPQCLEYSFRPFLEAPFFLPPFMPLMFFRAIFRGTVLNMDPF